MLGTLVCLFKCESMNRFHSAKITLGSTVQDNEETQSLPFLERCNECRELQSYINSCCMGEDLTALPGLQWLKSSKLI